MQMKSSSSLHTNPLCVVTVCVCEERREDHIHRASRVGLCGSTHSLPSTHPHGSHTHRAMSRKGRRDCRVADRKKNHMNARVEAMQKSIRKEKKQATSSTAAGAGAAAASTSAAPSLTASAASFLSEMRADVAAGVARTRAEHQPAVSTSTPSANDEQAKR